MSEYINNRELRKNTIKDIIKQLHAGKTVDEVKSQFENIFEGVSATEISEAEGALIAEGLPVEEVQRLCDVHAPIFKARLRKSINRRILLSYQDIPFMFLNLKIEKLKRL